VKLEELAKMVADKMQEESIMGRTIGIEF